MRFLIMSYLQNYFDEKTDFNYFVGNAILVYIFIHSITFLRCDCTVCYVIYMS